MGGEPPPADALIGGYDLRVIDRFDGLPSPIVRAVSLDEDGSLWLGTYGGLCRYDGLEFRSFHSASTEGLEADRIAALMLDRSGWLWIGPEKGPLSRYRDGTFEVVEPIDRLASVATMLQASDGTLWFGGDRLARWRDGQLEVFDLGFTPLKICIRALVEAPDGSILVACDSGLLRVPVDARTVEDFESIGLGTNAAEGAAGFYVDPTGHIWITSFMWASIDLSDDDRRRSESIMGRVHSALPIDGGRHLLATDNGLFVVSVAADGEVAFEQLATEYLARGMLETADGTIWIGAETHGLLQLRPRGYELADLRADVGASAVFPAPRSHRADVLVIRFDGVPVITDIDGLGDPLVVRATRDLTVGVFDTVMDGRGGLLAATDRGIARLEGGFLSLLNDVSPSSTCIVEAEDGSIWYEADRAFHELRLDAGIDGRRMPKLEVRPLDGIGWAGGFLGVAADRVIAYDTRNVSLSEFLHLPDVEIRALCADDDGSLWITSYGDGLFRRSPDGQVDQWTTRDGLPDDFLGWVGRSAAPDARDHLWLNSNSGAIRLQISSLARFTSGEEDTIACRLIPSPEGNGTTGAALDDGRIVLPTIQGVTIHDAGSFDMVVGDPNLVIDEIRVDGELLDMQRPPSGVVDLEIAYTGILLPSAREVVFQYRLRGYDVEWIDAGNHRVARYTNIRPGDYSFEVRARARDGHWPESPVVAEFSVVPLWYQRSSVRVLAAMGLVGAVVVGLRRRTRAILARSRALEREIERRRVVETELRASRAEHLSVLEAAQGGILTIDATGVISYANPSAVEIFGIPRHELQGADLSVLGIASLRDHVEETLQLPPGQPAARWETIETEATRRGGSAFDVELALSSQLRADEAYAVCIVRDVSERKRMTDQLRRSEERYRSLFHTAPAAIVVWRPDATIADWNERAAQLFGWTRDEAMGRNLHEVFGLAWPRDPLRIAAARSLAEKSSRSIVYTTSQRGGGQRLCRWRFTPLVNPDGTVRAVISLVSDITEEQRVSQDLDALRKRLARAEETERSRIARELHDDLSQRLAALSLEMQMAVDALEHSEKLDARSMLSSIQNDLQAVSTDVHALSRQLHPTVLDDLGLSRALRSECSRRRRGAATKIEFIDDTRGLDLAPDVALALFRIAQESMQNAIKHASATEVVVQLRESSGTLELEVRDDGVGFDSSTSAPGDAGGLGLASMRERARLVNADIDIRAANGKGTIVSVLVDRASVGVGDRS